MRQRGLECGGGLHFQVINDRSVAQFKGLAADSMRIEILGFPWTIHGFPRNQLGRGAIPVPVPPLPCWVQMRFPGGVNAPDRCKAVLTAVVPHMLSRWGCGLTFHPAYSCFVVMSSL